MNRDVKHIKSKVPTNFRRRWLEICRKDVKMSLYKLIPLFGDQRN